MIIVIENNRSLYIILPIMYRATQKNQNSMSRASNSVFLDTTNQCIEKEIDSYTRMLEQDKRKFFRAQENKQELNKQHSQKSKELGELMSRQFKNQTKKKQGELKILQGELEQTINGYNDVLACNKKLRSDIEELRKQRINQKEAIKKLQTSIGDLEFVATQKKKGLQNQKEHTETNKTQILKLKTQNEDQAKQWRAEACAKRNLLQQTVNVKTFFRKSAQMQNKNETTDSLPLVKHRLRQLMHCNKERQRIIESYQKTMETVRQVFGEISQESGNSNLEDIAETIVKQEEQHYSAYRHIDKLNKDIEEVQQQIQSTSAKITTQKEKNANYKLSLIQGPEQVKMKQTKSQLTCSYKQKISDFQLFIQNCGFSIQKLAQDFQSVSVSQVNQFNLQGHLAAIQNLVSEFYPEESAVLETIKSTTQLQGSKNGRLVGGGQQKEEKLWQGVKQFAEEYWQKRRIRIDGK